MGPFLGPFAAACLAALIAGAALGLTRLSRRSLEWWRRLRAPALRPLETVPEPEVAPLAPAFPGVHGAIACGATAAALIAVSALSPGVGLRGPIVPPALPSIPPHPFDPATFVPRALSVLGFAAICVAATLLLALLSALLDAGLRRALAGVFARFWPGPGPGLVRAPAAPADGTLSFADLRAGASALWGAPVRDGEPFGVGMGFVALFVTPVAAIALLLSAAPMAAMPAPALGAALMPREALLLLAVLFLAVPAAYAAAAERSQREEGASQRRRAALRQLLAAPLWALALLVLGAPGERDASLAAALGWILLAAAVSVALPGTTGRRALLIPPRGGDVAEPSAALRAITGVAHHGWLVAWTGYAGLALGPMLAPDGGPLALGLTVLGLLVAALAARTIGFHLWSRA